MPLGIATAVAFFGIVSPVSADMVYAERNHQRSSKSASHLLKSSENVLPAHAAPFSTPTRVRPADGQTSAWWVEERWV